MSFPALKSPHEWKTCPRCGEDWNNLTALGVCVQCDPEVRAQEKKNAAFKIPPVDLQSRAAGEDSDAGSNEEGRTNP